MSTYYHKVLSDSDIDGKSVKHTIKFIKVVASSKMLSTIHQKKKTAPGVAAPRTVIRGSKLIAYCPPIITNAGGKSNAKKSKYARRVGRRQHPAAS